MARAAASGPVIAADTARAREDWLAWLRHERRGSPHTIAAYGRDLSAFLGFLTGHLGQPAALADLSAVDRGDFRAWLAARGREGLTASSTARALSVLRSFFRFLARRGLGSNGAIGLLRSPKLPRSVPKALTSGEALEAVDAVGDLSDEPWVAKRDMALLALLYGGGLRLSEALSLNVGDLPKAKAGETLSLTITGKGRKQRLVPMLPAVREAIDDYLRAAPFSGERDGPLFRGVRGARLASAAGAAAAAEAAAAAGAAGNRHAPRAAPQLRHPHPGRRRRSPRHSGTARPRLAIDHAALHRRGCGGAAGGL